MTSGHGLPNLVAEVAMRALKDVEPSLRSVRLVRFVLFDEADHGVHEEALRRMTS